ncbi:MAG: hypothetical protein KDB23_15615 [Planctomycetales bacterium]|nr:hypothetical protein [Planctomycetales bacterium]
MYKSDPIEDNLGDYELSALEEQWQRQQPEYWLPGRNGRRIPIKTALPLWILTSAFLALGSLLLLGPHVIPTDDLPATPTLITVVGLFMLGCGVAVALYALMFRAQRNIAEARYLSRRQTLLDQYQ